MARILEILLLAVTGLVLLATGATGLLTPQALFTPLDLELGSTSARNEMRATYGGMHAMAGNPTGAMGVPDYLGWDWRSKADIPIVCVPGCPVQGDNLSETILYLLYMATGQAPMIPLDDALRPQWLFGATVHEGCDRAGYYEQGDFATEYGSPKCIVKLGCWGPVANCNVPKRGWINGVGGCPNGLRDADEAKRALGLDADEEIAVVLTFGYPARERDPFRRTPAEWSARADRKPLDELVRRV